MKLSGPKVTDTLVLNLLKQFNVDVRICGVGTHQPLIEICRRLRLGELELVTTNNDRELEIRQVCLIVRIIHKLTDLSFQEIFPQTTIFHDGSSIQQYNVGLTGIHSNLQNKPETARQIVFNELGQSMSAISGINLQLFVCKNERGQTLITERSNIWYGLKAISEITHFDLLLPEKYYKEEYIKKIRTVAGKVHKSTYYSWRPINT